MEIQWSIRWGNQYNQFKPFKSHHSWKQKKKKENGTDRIVFSLLHMSRNLSHRFLNCLASSSTPFDSLLLIIPLKIPFLHFLKSQPTTTIICTIYQQYNIQIQESIWSRKIFYFTNVPSSNSIPRNASMALNFEQERCK